jgi:hypothetical protein
MDASEQRYRALQRGADRVCALIFFERPEAEIEQARRDLRSEVSRLFPENTDLYERIYESRFRRLREQFPAERERLSRPSRDRREK